MEKNEREFAPFYLEEKKLDIQKVGSEKFLLQGNFRWEFNCTLRDPVIVFFVREAVSTDYTVRTSVCGALFNYLF